MGPFCRFDLSVLFLGKSLDFVRYPQEMVFEPDEASFCLAKPITITINFQEMYMIRETVDQCSCQAF